MNPGEADGLTDEEIKVRLVFDFAKMEIQMTDQMKIKGAVPR